MVAKVDKPHHMLYHDKDRVRIAEVVRYIVTYDPAVAHGVLSPHRQSGDAHVSKIFLRVRNCAQIIRRAQYLSGPYFIAVAVREAQFNANDEITGKFNQTPPPLYDPELKASKSFWAELEVNDRKYRAR